MLVVGIMHLCGGGEGQEGGTGGRDRRLLRVIACRHSVRQPVTSSCLPSCQVLCAITVGSSTQDASFVHADTNGKTCLRQSPVGQL